MNATDRKLAILQDLARIRRVQRFLPDNTDLMDVRIGMEEELGGYVSQRIAARALGISHTAIQRWVERGDLPTVITPAGKSAVPIGPLLRMMDSVDDVVRSGERKRHVIEPVVDAVRKRADELKLHLESTTADRADLEAHDAAQQRALDLHRAIAFRLDREAVDEAKRNLYRFEKQGTIHPTYADQWRSVLDGDIELIKRAITAEGQTARDLRQNSPFTGALSAKERDVIYSTRVE